MLSTSASSSVVVLLGVQAAAAVTFTKRKAAERISVATKLGAVEVCGREAREFRVKVARVRLAANDRNHRWRDLKRRHCVPVNALVPTKASQTKVIARNKYLEERVRLEGLDTADNKHGRLAGSEPLVDVAFEERLEQRVRIGREPFRQCELGHIAKLIYEIVQVVMHLGRENFLV